MTFKFEWSHCQQWCDADVPAYEWFTQPLAVPNCGVYEITMKSSQDDICVILEETIQGTLWVIGRFPRGCCTREDNQAKIHGIRRYCDWAINTIHTDYGSLAGLPLAELCLNGWENIW